jgi:hypothetical protein
MIAELQTGQNGELVRSLPIALPTSANGRPRPFQIVSLYDVIRFPAEQCLTTIALLTSLSAITREEHEEFKNSRADIQETFKREIGYIRTLCEIMEFEYSIDEIKYLNRTCIDGDGGRWVEINKLLASLARRFKDEMRRVECMFIPAPDLKYFEKDSLFGDRVASRFPSAAIDIKAAGTSYATDNATACVMHSMRVLELGIGALAKQFRVSFQHSNWGKVIGQIEKKITAIETKKRKPKGWRQDRQFYSEAAIHFRFLKDAWRNYSMHVHEQYDTTSALTIMNHVHEFMDHLSERLDE